MKKKYFFLILILFILSIFVSNLLLDIGIKKDNDFKNNNKINTGILLDDKNTITHKEISKEELKEDCRNAVAGKKINLIDKTKLYGFYIIQKNELDDSRFQFFLDFKNGKINIDNEILKEKKGTYSHTLLTSIKDNKNYCFILKNLTENNECNLYFAEYQKIDINNTELIANDILFLSRIGQSKMINKFGEKKYLEMLDKKFLEECYLLEIKDLGK